MTNTQATQRPAPMSWAAPTMTPAPATWKSGDAWMAGGNLHIKDVAAPIPLSAIQQILVVDESYKKTPGWAVVCAIFLFPIGLLFLLSKDEVPRSRIVIYVRGSSTPITTVRSVPAGQAQVEWYPVHHIAMSNR